MLCFLKQAWSANGERLAAGCDDGKVHIFRSGRLNKFFGLEKLAEKHAIIRMKLACNFAV